MMSLLGGKYGAPPSAESSSRRWAVSDDEDMDLKTPAAKDTVGDVGSAVTATTRATMTPSPVMSLSSPMPPSSPATSSSMEPSPPQTRKTPAGGRDRFRESQESAFSSPSKFISMPRDAAHLSPSAHRTPEERGASRYDTHSSAALSSDDEGRRALFPDNRDITGGTAGSVHRFGSLESIPSQEEGEEDARRQRDAYGGNGALPPYPDTSNRRPPAALGYRRNNSASLPSTAAIVGRSPQQFAYIHGCPQDTAAFMVGAPTSPEGRRSGGPRQRQAAHHKRAERRRVSGSSGAVHSQSGGKPKRMSSQSSVSSAGSSCRGRSRGPVDDDTPITLSSSGERSSTESSPERHLSTPSRKKDKGKYGRRHGASRSYSRHSSSNLPPPVVATSAVDDSWSKSPSFSPSGDLLGCVHRLRSGKGGRFKVRTLWYAGVCFVCALSVIACLALNLQLHTSTTMEDLEVGRAGLVGVGGDVGGLWGPMRATSDADIHSASGSPDHNFILKRAPGGLRPVRRGGVIMPNSTNDVDEYMEANTRKALDHRKSRQEKRSNHKHDDHKKESHRDKSHTERHREPLVELKAIDRAELVKHHTKRGHPRVIAMEEFYFVPPKDGTLKFRPPPRELVLYPSEFTDNTQLYPIRDSEDEALEKMEIRDPHVQGDCVPMQDWQTTFNPSCNGMHELDIVDIAVGEDEGTNITLFGTKGFWRNAWKVDLVGNNRTLEGRDTVVLKTLKYVHNFEDAHFEHDRIDAVAMERLTGSPHVINIFGFCGHSVLTEFADGPRLGELADKSRKKPLKRLSIARDIASGLADVHGIDGDGNATFVHLDINPANVVSIGGTLKLNDFNIGILRKWNTTSNEACGFPAQYPNPQWRSPEEANESQELTEKVDVFAMGHIFFRLICGHEPWNKLEPGGRPSKEEVTEKVKAGQLPYIPEFIRNATDPELIIIRTAMVSCYTKDPKKRPSSRQVAKFLNEGMHRLEEIERKKELAKAAKKKRRMEKEAAAAAAATAKSNS